MKPVIIIPTLNPPPAMLSLVDALIGLDATRIIIVNDGSDPAFSGVFSQAAAYPQVTVLTHPVNRGKGAALKTAFVHCLTHHPDITGVVTADDDGQHTARDIARVADALSRQPQHIVLGVRHFDKKETPFRSYFGNTVVNHFIRFLFGIRLTDSQTGLRGIPASALPWMATLKGEHYEFEINMLLQAVRKKVAITEIPIQLLYFDNNKASHYKTVTDTLRIAGLIGRNLIVRDAPYGSLFYFCRFMVRRFQPALRVAGAHIDPPAVYIARHRNLKGVMAVFLWFDQPLRVWTLDVFCDRARCFDQYAHYTFTQRFGWPRVVAYPVAFLVSRFVPRLMRSMQAIPVHRSSMRQMRATLDRSVDALCRHENIIIFPDMDYTSEADTMGAMYTGFINLDKLYHARTGRHIQFVPLRVHQDRIEAGAPESLQDGEGFVAGKQRVAAALRAYLS